MSQIRLSYLIYFFLATKNYKKMNAYFTENLETIGFVLEMDRAAVCTEMSVHLRHHSAAACSCCNYSAYDRVARGYRINSSLSFDELFDHPEVESLYPMDNGDNYVYIPM